jgi:histidinol-phosphate phosphatase family protein
MHVGVTGAAGSALVARLTGRRRTSVAAAAVWLAGTVEFAWIRIAPGPRTPGEVAAMALTSLLIPPMACYHRVAGLLHRRALLADSERASAPGGDGERQRPPDRDWFTPVAVLLDRDGTLIEDVPYNGDPDRVVPMRGAREALVRLREAGVALGVVSNQSGVARGLLTSDDVAAVNARVEELLGPLGPWAVCPHGPDSGCSCRKPAPGLVLRAARELGVDPARCAVVGDIGADVEAARAAGARGVLVPTERTLAAEVEAAPEVAPDLGAAVELLLGREAA